MRRLIALLGLALITIGARGADSKVTVSQSGMTPNMTNGIVKITIGSNGRISNMTLNNGANVIGSSGVYFDYTAASNTGLNPGKA